ncbi:arsenical resistance protein ArsH [Pseudomonas aeruginosa BWH054]|nr:arsenical resistance protein ArsH [Pseudomonas aeruginosa BWH054]
MLEAFGAESRIFNPSGLPMPDDADSSHPKVKELIDLVLWSEGQVWCSPERHGAMTGVFKSQIDWIPLSMGAIRPSQGKTLAVMQVCGGSQSFSRPLKKAMSELTVAYPYTPTPLSSKSMG